MALFYQERLKSLTDAKERPDILDHLNTIKRHMETLTLASRAHDWLNQARRDLDHARNDLKSGFFEWGCFSAQQSAEKAVKALYQSLHAEAWGHSVKRLLEDLPESLACPEAVIQSGIQLDKFYIPTRYPNGFDQGSPSDYFLESDLKGAIQHAERIIRFCENHLS